MSFIVRATTRVLEVHELAYPTGLLFAGFLVRTILGAAVVVVLVLFLWKVSKLADAYAEKLKSK